MEEPTMSKNFREKAEDYLEKQGGRLQEYSKYSSEELLHELQVHQIELELQNDELKNSQLKLQQERAKYSTLFNLAPVGYFSLDKHGYIKEMNYAAEHMLDRESAGVTGSKFTDFIFPEDQDLFYFHFQDILKYGKGKPREIRLIKPDNNTFYVRLQSTTIKDAVSGLTIFMAVIDITEMIHIRDQLKAAKAEAEAASRTKSQFLANMSHEIRTPMNGILGMLEIAMMADLPDEQLDHLKLAKSSADNLLGILNDILDLSKIEAKKLSLQKTEFNPGAVISGVARLLSVTAWRKGVELVAGVDPSISEKLIGDPVRLKQILFNLLSNAVKFTEEGEIVLQVTLEDGAPPGIERLKFICRDTGIGIAPENVERLFMSFTQADEATTRKYGGTGLGLAISAKLIEMMGSSIHVNTAEGRGSTFSFTVDFHVSKDGGKLKKKGTEKKTYVAPVKHIIFGEAHDTSRRVIDMYLEEKKIPVYHISPSQLPEQDISTLKEQVERMGAPEEQVLLIAAEGSKLEALLEQFSQDTLLSRLPVVLACYPPEYADYRSRLARFNIKRIIEKPVDYVDINDVLDELFMSEVPHAHKASAPSLSEQPVLTPTVLVAEDNDINMKVISDYFSRRKWNILQCRNGREAIEQFLLHLSTIDAVLMDIQMPVMDGFDTIKKLRSEAGEAGARVPIIAMTAYAMSSDRERCYRVGADDYITKPISSMENLAALVEKNIQKAGQHNSEGESTPKKEEDAVVKIVIAEDENINRMFLQRVLEKAGHQVIGTKDGEKALTSIIDERPQLAIIDLQLPKKDGVSIIHEMFKNETTSHIPVIIISGRSEEEVKSCDLPENVVGIISKPVDSSTLLEYIETNITQKGT